MTEHRDPCNALVTKSDVDCTCGALTPEQCAALSTKDAVTYEGWALSTEGSQRACCHRFIHGDGTHDVSCSLFRGVDAETEAGQ